MAKNLQAKRVPVNQAYEIWLSFDGRWIYHVLRKYQSSPGEDKNPCSKWHVATVSPMTHGSFEYGDAYVTSIKNGNRNVVSNPRAYTIMFHVHAERPGEGNVINTIDTWPMSLKKALELYEQYVGEYLYVDLVAELYHDVSRDPATRQRVCSCGVRLCDTDVRP